MKHSESFGRLAMVLVPVCLTIPVRAGGLDAQEGGSVSLQERRVLEQAEQLESAGRPEEALVALEAWMEESPASSSALVLLFRLAERVGMPERAVGPAVRAYREDVTDLPVIRQVWIRALWAAGHADSARAVAARWIADRPAEPAAHSELADLHLRQGDRAEAISVLVEARQTLRSDGTFAQELGLLWTEAGQYSEAAREWLKLLGWGDPGVDVVVRHVTEVAMDSEAALVALRSALESMRPGGAVGDAAIRVALRVGEYEWARSLVEDRLRGAPGQAGTLILEDFAQRARGVGDAAGASWAAENIARRVSGREQAEYWTTVGGELALEAGDRERARRAFDHLRQTSLEGSDVHRLALRRLHDLVVLEEPGRGEDLLFDYRKLYPEDLEALDHLAIATARAWIQVGDLRRSRHVLDAISPTGGAVGAREEVLGRLHIMEGDPGGASAHLELAVGSPDLDAGARMRAVRWLSVLERVDSASAVRLSAGVRAAWSGKPGPLVEVTSRWGRETAESGAALCALAAEELEAAGHVDQAALVRRTLVDSWPESAEAPGALFALARYAVPRDEQQARRWLERLVVEHPRNAMAPVARRELSALQGTVPGS